MTQSFQRAVASFRQGRLAEADAACVEVLRKEARHFDAVHLRGLVALQGGQVARAIELFRQSLALNPNQPVAHMNLANALLRAGKPQAALLSSDSALALRPDYVEALNSRGNALLELKRADEALALYDRALQLRPELAFLHSNRGRALRDLQRPQEALDSYLRSLQLQSGLRESLIGCAEALRALGRPREAIAYCVQSLIRNPQDVEALHLRAKAFLDEGLSEEALADLGRALLLRPQSPALLLERGNVLCKLERAEEALADYRQVADLTPGDSEALVNQGHALLLLKRYEEALATYEEAIVRNPNYAKAHCYRGNSLRMLGRFEEGLVSYAQALALEPDYPGALIGKGNTLCDLGRLPEALAAYDEGLRIEPDSLELLSERAGVLMLGQRWEDAAASLERLLEINPVAGPAYNYSLGFLLQSRLNCCDWRDYETTTATIEAGVASGKPVTIPSLFTASGLTPELHNRCARAFVTFNTRGMGPVEWTGPRYSHERIRLAYVSPDFREHPVSMLMANIFETHDRTRFETTALSIRPPDSSALGRRVQGAFDRFIDVTDYRDHDVIALMKELEIDICIDLSGYTAYMRAGIFARRGAPIQVNYLGYPGTLGAPYMDYIIADRVLIPEADQAHYCERVAYLPHTYLPPGDRRAPTECPRSRTDCGLPERGLVFCAFNAHGKFTPQVFDVWMRLLHAVEGSVLWLSFGNATVTRNLTREAASRGIDPERLVFAPRMPDLKDHLARHLLADLFLDTLPYNAHTTARDALWAGLPVLTCRGASFAGRVAAGLLTALELPELVVESLEDYEARALHLARNPALLRQLRTRLLNHRDTHPMFDADLFRRHLEAIYIRMWERFERGEAPTSFAV